MFRKYVSIYLGGAMLLFATGAAVDVVFAGGPTFIRVCKAKTVDGKCICSDDCATNDGLSTECGDYNVNPNTKDEGICGCDCTKPFLEPKAEDETL